MIRFRSRGGYSPTEFSAIKPLFNNRSPFVFLDRDGTIVPLATNPDDAVLTAHTSEILSRLSRHLSGRVAIISARGLNHLSQEFARNDFILAGNYGLEISLPCGRTILHPAAAEAKTQIQALWQKLTPLDKQQQLLIDNHLYSLCIHFDRLDHFARLNLHKLLKEVEQDYSALLFRQLPTSYEILPLTDWNKGMAMDTIIMELTDYARDLLYLVFGDSSADEPMFRWVNRHKGLSFFVGTPSTTAAMSTIDTTEEVVAFLEQILLLPAQRESQL